MDGAGCVGCAGDESVWAAGRVGKDTPAVGAQGTGGGGRVRVGGVGSDWWGEGYLGR